MKADRGAVPMSCETPKSDHVGRWRADGVDFYRDNLGRTGAICGLTMCQWRAWARRSLRRSAAGLCWGSSGSVGGGWRGLRVAV